MNELFSILSESHLSWDADLVAVEVGKGKRIGKGRLKVISDDLDVSLDIYPNCGLTR